ncbi:MAG: esterase, depolymerase family [Dactylosporangium sp.]|nr:esterase, depolymerase family [Dactylosporangium sp.]
MIVATLAIFMAQRLHANGAGQRGAGGAVPTAARSPAPSPSRPLGCSASFAVASAWPTGFQANVTVRSNGSAAISGWTVTWTFPSDQTVMQLWNGRYAQTKTAVRVESEGWNGSPPAADSTTFGFVGSGPAPTAVQSLTCTVSVVSRSPSPSMSPSRT